MKRIILAIISALFIGALVTEFYSRIFADNYFALFLLASLGAAAAALIVSSGYAATATSGQKRAHTGKSDRSETRRNSNTRETDKRQRNKSTTARKEQSKSSSAAEPAVIDHSVGDRETGTVKWFNRNKGFGFIVRENGEEIFVHYRSIRGAESDKETRHSLRDGQAVAFRVVEKSKGPQADDVSPLDDPRM